ncbi:WD repeat-containing protein KLLA0C16533g [Kluyveromyces marxianus]|uniref:DNA damage-binding protein CMR1 n=1 Tax=Kluyveromyces marxianus (strain DMKU3-1042 / BCC 29191 / NBRC 104275) TaxID=1003335 RepID=W0TEM1_KLUMD|nr:uncharacterized protein KLMA_70244 [Kluyveromyces marxianus DMKU3-1042]BAO42092.1 WD repeat-containing protein KLLA0C16533g [Kluyveromyces marxianus DMKU3-1042]BAP73508.1 WD repeat-containing protein KLLA0C16533g [Kluyveromyces marxianus]
MGELTEFQLKRLENIKRNNELLKKLNLSNISSEIKREAGVDENGGPHKEKKKRNTGAKRVTKREPKPAPIPTRRSRRLRGETVDGDGIPNVNDNQLLKMGQTENSSRDMEALEQLKNTAVSGDVKIADLIKSENEDDLLDKFSSFAKMNFSSGDFFKELQKHQKPTPEVQQLQEDFDLKLYDIFQPNEIKLTFERISAAYFHPSVDKKLVICGDTAGNVGLWNVRETEPEDEMEEPDITRVKLFTKNVGRIDTFATDSSRLLTASYDGSLRSINLENMQSEEILVLKNEYDDALGISDFQFSYDDPNTVFLTTLSGEFTSFDTRTKPSDLSLKRLADKKIGSFSINPKRPYEIATGSLDRTLKIWDTRKLVDKPEWSQYEDFPSLEVVSVYDSRLSVSAVSYSPMDGTLVCNGYDDTIRLFDVSNVPDRELQPKLTLKHNCQTGRWTSILKARFKPNMDVFAIANMKRAIDIYNSAGVQLAHLPTATVPAVLSWHPTQNWIVGGNSSGKAFLFTDKAA